MSLEILFKFLRDGFILTFLSWFIIYCGASVISQSFDFREWSERSATNAGGWMILLGFLCHIISAIGNSKD